MAEITKYGVCYDIENSPYEYMWGGILFKFSSEPHRHKFMNNIYKKVGWLNDSLSRRFRVSMDVSELAAIQLYQQVETRGFCIIYNGSMVIKCPEQLVFHGRLYNDESSDTRYQPTTQLSRACREISDMLG